MGEAHAALRSADTGRGWGRKEASGREPRAGLPLQWLLCFAGNEGNEVKCHTVSKKFTGSSDCSNRLPFQDQEGRHFPPSSGPCPSVLSSDFTSTSPPGGRLLTQGLGWGSRCCWPPAPGKACLDTEVLEGGGRRLFPSQGAGQSGGCCWVGDGLDHPPLPAGCVESRKGDPRGDKQLER